MHETRSYVTNAQQFSEKTDNIKLKLNEKLSFLFLYMWILPMPL
jgi:hypothetical protein